MANQINLSIDQGSDYSRVFELTDDNGGPYDLTGFTAEAKFAKHYAAANSYSFTCLVDEDAGSITITLSRDSSANVEPGRYVYDLEILDTESNVVVRVCEGIVTIRPQVVP